MIPRECKRLAEVDFPIAEVSKHSAREKSIRHGHPSTLHLWWARRPMAACRAMLMALLLPDPCDETCPDEFKIAARKALGQTWHKLGPEDGDLRAALLKFIADFAAWERSADPTYLETARSLVKAAYPEEAPTVVDSFAGGGTIPSEALRLGCEAFANDLNPIAGLICKVLLEDVPRHGSLLIDALKREVAALNTALKAQISAFYPARISGEEPTAYLWARVVRCEAPHCGAAIPLLRSLWLSKGDSSRSALRVTVERPSGKSPDVILSVYEPSPDEQVGAGTVSGGRAVCPACTIPLLRPAVESQLKVQRGGTDSARLVAVMVATPEGRKFRTPATSDHKALQQVRERDALSREAEYAEGIPVYPNELLNPVRPSPNARGLSAVTRYGMATFSDCYLPRQRVVLSEFVKFVRNYNCNDPGLDGAVGRCLLIILGRCVDRWSSCSRLDSSRDTVTGSFSKQALQLVWDFCEANPFSEWSGGLANAVEWVEKALERAMISFVHPGQVRLGDARALPLPDQSVGVWFTDPPYYDSVPYADLADFFFCWLKRANPAMGDRRDPLDQSNTLTPKREECVWNQSHYVDGKPKDASFFEGCVSNAFDEGKRVLDANGIGCVVFAHKSTEGWEALLNGLLSAGLCITCSWPVQTEMKSRTAARNAASLMGSVHLVCRPRPEDAPVGEWGEVLRELPKRVGEWMDRLEQEGVRGADLVFACIGPALEIFSRYVRVETPDGTEKTLAEYLEKVWEVVGRVALEQILGSPEAKARNGAAGALEEDARLTALFLWTLQATNGQPADSSEESVDEDTAEDEDEATAPGKKKPGFTLIYDVARRFAQPLGIHLSEWEGRIVETKKGVVRLLPVRERSQQLFGEAGADLAAERIERVARGAEQLDLFSAAGLADAAVPDVAPKRGRKKGVADDALKTRREATTLDRVHAAMLLQASGRANALRSLLKSETERTPDFLRLANALSALYPKESEEKRLLDAMLLAAPR